MTPASRAISAPVTRGPTDEAALSVIVPAYTGHQSYSSKNTVNVVHIPISITYVYLVSPEPVRHRRVLASAALIPVSVPRRRPARACLTYLPLFRPATTPKASTCPSRPSDLSLTAPTEARLVSSTAVLTVYRLSGVAPTPEAMLDGLDLELLDRIGADPHFPEVLGVPAVYITCGMEHTKAPWCQPMSRTTGITVTESVQRTAAVLLLAIEGTVHAIGCDQRYRLIPDHLEDKRFGLSFAIRQMDPNMIRGAVSKTLGQMRTDISLVPGGTPVPLLGIRDHSRIVRSLGGYLDDLPLTRSRYTRGKAVTQVSVAAVARRADVSRTFLYDNAEARAAVASAMAEVGTARSQPLAEKAEEREAAWRERALNAEETLKGAHTEIHRRGSAQSHRSESRRPPHLGRGDLQRAPAKPDL
ncbi:TIGR04141 family sporadically distributed protein [Streptomyces sp. NPDC056291]|uniref:TIGR04141 family sporadically distributed protein n=1 Tax=Streptomyces sp. NPDC056291 TaxID=3345772 RepID=UPI0035E283E2